MKYRSIDAYPQLSYLRLYIRLPKDFQDDMMFAGFRVQLCREEAYDYHEVSSKRGILYLEFAHPFIYVPSRKIRLQPLLRVFVFVVISEAK